MATNSRYRKTNIFENLPIVEITIVVLLFLLSIGLLFLPKELLYKISIMPFISVIS